jgi:hypothetical protein
MSHEKPRWSGAGQLLVDDRASARDGWERKGGRFIHHVSAAASIAQLRALGFEGTGKTCRIEAASHWETAMAKKADDQPKPAAPMEPQFPQVLRRRHGGGSPGGGVKRGGA